ncbi:sulfite exporter TauE/SafE family protein [candidate division WWE3 bacterium]|uniref:Sulfite exporter TauE/SafE family protein n=1 Tax=candidate division WWE3 bacterium TaxID=2053526 RepID=A0A955RQW1_UNCKA|nr:sulfite exporter TauE/SafE family protein [candidate division WWE3 bacterium]
MIKSTLETIEGVLSVDASTSSGEVIITHKKGLYPDLKRLNKALAEYGYTLGYKDDDSERSLIYFENGGIFYNPAKMKQFLGTSLVVLVLVAAFYLISGSGIASRVMVSSDTGPLVYLLFGLVAGASTCAALVGGVLLSLSKSWNKIYASQGSRLSAAVPHVMFYTGRLIAFALAGGVLALVGASITETITKATPVITVVVSSVMFVLGLQMLNVSWAKKIRIALPSGVGFRVSESSTDNKGKFGPLSIGAASLLLPCGMTLTAFIASITSGSFVVGAINMFSFAFGTMLSLSFISIVSIGFSNHKIWSNRFNTVAGIMVLFFAIFTLNAQLNAAGLPSLTDVSSFINPGSSTQAVEDGSKNVQVIKMVANRSGYSPTSFTVRSGVPVRWEVNNTGASGCTNVLIARDFFSGNFPLNPGVNVKEFTPQKPGTYKFSCWMGMVSGVIKVT